MNILLIEGRNPNNKRKEVEQERQNFFSSIQLVDTIVSIPRAKTIYFNLFNFEQ